MQIRMCACASRLDLSNQSLFALNIKFSVIPLHITLLRGKNMFQNQLIKRGRRKHRHLDVIVVLDELAAFSSVCTVVGDVGS